MSNLKTRHTPGPWNIKTPTDFIGPFQHIVDKTGWMVANVNSTSDGPVLKVEREANARLISAAPELLDALVLVLNDNRLMNAMNREQARAILDSVAKARGES